MIDRNARRTSRNKLLIVAAVAAALIALVAGERGCRAAEVHSPLALAKCRFLWERINAKSYKPELADWFVERHYAAGVGPDWIHSFVYCWSGSDLNPSMVSGDTLGGYHARGLVDTLWSTHRGNRASVAATLEARGLEWNEKVLHDPFVAARLHLIEWLAYRDPDNPWRTARKVFLPMRPDSGRAFSEQHRRWEPRMRKAEDLLREGYRKHILPSPEGDSIRAR